MKHVKQRRRAMSLLELLAVVTIMGIMASVVMARHGRTLFANFGSQSDARKLSLSLIQAKRRAITTGLEHAVVLSGSSYSVMSIDSGGATTLVDGPNAFTSDVTVTSSHAQLRFNFEGQAGGAYWVQLQSASRRWRIDVIPITGALSVTDTRL